MKKLLLLSGSLLLTGAMIFTVSIKDNSATRISTLTAANIEALVAGEIGGSDDCWKGCMYSINYDCYVLYSNGQTFRCQHMKKASIYPKTVS